MAEILFVCSCAATGGCEFQFGVCSPRPLFPKMAYNETFLLIGWSFNLE